MLRNDSAILTVQCMVAILSNSDYIANKNNAFIKLNEHRMPQQTFLINKKALMLLSILTAATLAPVRWSAEAEESARGRKAVLQRREGRS